MIYVNCFKTVSLSLITVIVHYHFYFCRHNLMRSDQWESNNEARLKLVIETESQNVVAHNVTKRQSS